VATLVALTLGLVGLGINPPARADEPVVRAVIFYSPACGHCHRVMTQDLPPLVERYGDRLHIAAVDVEQDAGRSLFLATVERFGVEGLGVPTLVVGDVVLVGSVEIPERLPGLVEQYLAAGGVGWPDVPGLAEAMARTEPTSAVPSAGLPDEPSGELAAPGDDLAARLGRDPVGSGLAVAVLAAMLSVLAWVALVALRAGGDLAARPPSSLVAALALGGAAVAAYLALVETAGVPAVCGPVGDCTTVQQSEFARFLGVLPVGVAGLAGYAAILGTWVLARRPGPGAVRPARLALVALAAGGTVVSAWLTFLEPFVIGAICAWCLTSAVLMTLVLVVAVRSMAAPRAAPGSPPPAPSAS
jgi:uncharacterized membrane protein